MIRALQQLLNFLLPVYRPHPFFQTYRTQAFELAQDTIQQTSPHPAAGFSMVATERPIDRSRPEPPPPRAFKLAKKVNINRAHSKKRAVRIPEESHESSRAVHLPIRKPNQSSSAVELALPFAARNLSCDKPSNDAKNSTTPTYSYLDYRNPPAAVLYTQCEDEANDLVQSLESPLGFDMEWRVKWQAGAAERRTALVQLCDSQTILLIHISNMKRFPRKVLEVIECPNIVKTGANIKKDGEKLYRDFGIRARGLVELGALAAKADEKFKTVYKREVVSLAKMVSVYLGKTLVKTSVRTSNWEAKLTSEMVDYTANDCHCAVMVYNTLVEKAAEEGKRLDVSMYSCVIDPRTVKLGVESRATAWETSSNSSSSVTGPPSFRDYCIPEPASPQYLRAYKMWYEHKMPLDKMCFELKTGGRTEPLKTSTVISYVVGALQADASLPFDLRELRELVQMEVGSWQRHRAWIHERERRTFTTSKI
ncbi:ribonuclease H-like protein [Pisolithus tinctorius]|nr:ribonuclease H-like protein [Pisolithus tinctorius]